MASKRKTKASKGEDAPLSAESQSKKKLLQRVLDRVKLMIEADQENRDCAMEDIRFVNEPGAQWDTTMKDERGDRPCLEANTLRINGKRIINEIRANRPQGHVGAVEGGDKEGAELREGLVRNILTQSDFDSITDYEAEYQVDGGFGAWRVDTEYAAEDVFDQDIRVNPFKNPFCLYWDPSAKDLLLKRDAEDWAVIDTMAVSAFNAKYGEREQFDFSADDIGQDDWEDGETVRVCEYWYKEPYNKTLVQVQTPTGVLVVDTTADEWAGTEQAIKAGEYVELRRREVKCQRIMMCVASGKSILEGPVEQPGTMFPFVVAHGEIKVVDGKVRWWGLHRFSKDAQQIQNVFWSAAAETVALAPKSHTWITAKQAEGYLQSYAEAHKKNIPIRVYNSDPTSPNPPTQSPGAQVPVAMLEMVALSGDLIRTTSGLHEASFGEESDEKSGIALARKQRQAQIVTYNFPDNMAKAAKRTGEIILDRIPSVYDAERELRVLGVDGAEDYKRVNQVVFDPATGKSVRVNDLTAGKYDYYVKSGPSFSSQREEASEIYGEFVQKFPELMGVAGDLVFKASDLPYSNEIAERLQTLLPPPIQAQLAEKGSQAPEVRAAMAQVQNQAAMVQQQGQLVQQAAQEAQEEVVKAKEAKTANEKVLASIKVERADWEAEIVKREAALAIKEAAMNAKAAEIDQSISSREQNIKVRDTMYKADKERDARDNKELGDTRQAVVDLDQAVAQALTGIVQKLGAVEGEVTKPKPKFKGAQLTRGKDGAMMAEVQFDDGSVKRTRAERKNGKLVAVPVEDAAPAGQPQG